VKAGGAVDVPLFDSPIGRRVVVRDPWGVMVHRHMESLPIQPSEYRGRRLTVAGAGWRVNPPRAQAQRCGPRRPDRQPAGERTVPRAPHTPSGHRAGRPRVEHSHNVLRRRAGLTSPRNVLKSVRSPRSILPVPPSTPPFRPPISPTQQREPSPSAGSLMKDMPRQRAPLSAHPRPMLLRNQYTHSTSIPPLPRNLRMEPLPSFDRSVRNKESSRSAERVPTPPGGRRGRSVIRRIRSTSRR